MNDNPQVIELHARFALTDPDEGTGMLLCRVDLLVGHVRRIHPSIPHPDKCVGPGTRDVWFTVPTTVNPETLSTLITVLAGLLDLTVLHLDRNTRKDP